MSEAIIVSGRRRAWPEEVKQQILAEALLPGESICSVARRHELDPAQLYQWRRKFREAEARGSLAMPVTEFVPVDIRMEEQVSPADRPSEQADLQHMARPRVERQDCRQMEIVLGNGRRLLLPLTVSPAVLKEVVDVLERA